MVECYIWIGLAYSADKPGWWRAFFLVRLAGFEPAAYGLEVRCSIQLSYRRPCKQELCIPYVQPDVHLD